ncbi:PA14 domain-containing protein [Planctomycetota bacterium]
MAKIFNPYAVWLGIDSQNQHPNYYQLLGLNDFESDPELIRDAAGQRMARIKVFATGPHSCESQQLLNEIARAKVDLLDVSVKNRYDAELRKSTTASDTEESETVVSTTRSDATEVIPELGITTDIALRQRVKSKRSRMGIRLAVFVSLVVTMGVLFLLARPTKPNQIPKTIAAIGDKFTVEHQSIELPVRVDISQSSQEWSIRISDGPGLIYGDREKGFRYRWIPSEIDGGSKRQVTLELVDQAKTVIDSESFIVGVREVHQPPRVAPIANREMSVGSELEIEINASDLDVPHTNLKVRIVNDESGSAKLNGNTIVFRATSSQIGRQSIEIEVGKSGVENCRTLTSFEINVVEAGVDSIGSLASAIIPRQVSTKPGLKAVYSTGIMQIDPQIDFVGIGGPPGRSKRDRFSATWSGWISPPSKGQYTLVVLSDDPFTLSLNDTIVLQNQTSGYAVRRDQCTYEFDGLTEIELHYEHQSGPPLIMLRWMPPGESEESSIPSECFFPSEKQMPGHSRHAHLVPSGEFGLSESLYAGDSFNYLVANRVAPIVDCLFGVKHWRHLVPKRFSVRWRGKLQVPGEGYELSVVTNGGAKVWLDDELVLNEWDNVFPQRFEPLELREGTIPLAIEYHNNSRNSLFSLRWIPLGGTDESIPFQVLIPDLDVGVANDPSQAAFHWETLIDSGDRWSYLDDGSDPGYEWCKPEFNSPKWKKSGRSPLGYDTNSKVIEKRISHKSKVDYGTDAKKHATTYFRHEFNVDDPSTISRVDLDLLRDDAAAVFLNGIEVYRDKCFPDKPRFDQYARTETIAANSELFELQFVSIAIDPRWLVERRNLLAVEVHQIKPSSTDQAMDVKLSAASAVPVTKRLEPQSAAFLDGTAAIDTMYSIQDTKRIVIETYVLPLANAQDYSENEIESERQKQIIIGNLTEVGGMALSIEYRRWQFEWHDGRKLHVVRSDTPPVADKWTHVAGIWDGKQITLLVERSPQGLPLPVSNVGVSKSPFLIGARRMGGRMDQHFSGLVDDVRIAHSSYLGKTTRGTRLQIGRAARLFRFDNPDRPWFAFGNRRDANSSGAKVVEIGIDRRDRFVPNAAKLLLDSSSRNE